MGTREEEASLGMRMFVDELVAARTAAGLTQAALAAKINYSESLISMIERYLRTATPDLAKRLDQVFATTGTFARLQGRAKTSPVPAWFVPFTTFEATATQVSSWQPSLIEGLFQTEDYARAILSDRPNATEEEIEELVAARMERQRILDRENPPLVWAVMDEQALHRCVGSEKIMRDQLFHIAEVSLRPNINIQVVPSSAGGHNALSGALSIAESPDGRVGYLETALEGYIVETPSIVVSMMLIFDTVRTEALPRAASLDLIRKLAKETYGPE